jgi:hypothetical protein
LNKSILFSASQKYIFKWKAKLISDLELAQKKRIGINKKNKFLAPKFNEISEKEGVD